MGLLRIIQSSGGGGEMCGSTFHSQPCNPFREQLPTVTYQLYRQPWAHCVWEGMLLQDCKMIGNKLGGWGGKLFGLQLEGSPLSFTFILLSSWFKLFQDPSFHFRKLFGSRGCMLTCHFLELEKTSPIVLEVPKDLGSEMELH